MILRFILWSKSLGHINYNHQLHLVQQDFVTNKLLLVELVFATSSSYLHLVAKELAANNPELQLVEKEFVKNYFQHVNQRFVTKYSCCHLVAQQFVTNNPYLHLVNHESGRKL